MTLRLVTIPLSHFCEKARWGLERAGLGYEELGNVPGLHVFSAQRHGRQRQVPVLVHEHGVITESSGILRWANERGGANLYPSERRDEVEALCTRFDDELGPASRLFFYHHALGVRDVMLRLFAQKVPAWQRFLLPGMYPQIRKVIARTYGSAEVDAAMQAREAVLSVFDLVKRTLGERRYLVGDSFTAADLTFAALCGPLVLPDGYGIALGAPSDLPRAFALQAEALREHPAGQHALRMYREERR